ncbi:TPR-like protein [Metschnikowia bicuspidata]|uniref:Peroxisomal targeting signal receptor n=1 Tax=Metschnikowia bicuspidata TaxID=27322 RepID=A0A4P9ZDG8_9ASCO|nr:TPR-like protein [Metschnikowia bicuspidata]
MSLFDGTECSVGNNALSQLNKHSQQDRSLQRQTPHAASATAAFKSEKMMDHRDMDQFRAGSHSNSFLFQPMRHEINRIHHSMLSWLQDFLAPQQLQPSLALSSASPQAISGWATEFLGAQITQPLQSQQSRMYRPAYSSYVPPMGMSASHVPLQGMASVHRSHAAPKEEAAVDWDNHFREIEEFSADAQDAKEDVAEPDTVLETEVDDKFQASFQEVWDLLNQDTTEDDLISEQYQEFWRSQGHTMPADMLQWEKDFARYASTRANFGDYNFEDAEHNQFMDLPADLDPYEIGLQLMENGAKLSEAALAFEAAINKDADRVEAWLKLGEVQTQNEKEVAGITALEKCLELHPENSEALMTLAISYINEGYDNAAFATLERWLSTKYPQIAERARQESPSISDEDRFTLHKRVTELFIKAAQLSPDQANMDADVQMGLGVLFYANEDFDKTIDCFKAALSIRPDDPVLWNRLGASMANSNRPEEAVDAYFKALELRPTFVRARYNLGVSCINIGCYKEAAEHLLSGLAMHEVEGQESTLSHNQSSSLMETLKRAFIAMDRRDLIEKVRPGMSLEQFRDEFSF